MLKKIQLEKINTDTLPDPPMQKCDCCGSEKRRDYMIDVNIHIYCPGHPSLTGVSCEQHWACSIDCWLKVAHACIDEHGKQILEFLHGNLTNTV